MTAPRTLTELTTMPPGEERCHAIAVYIDAGQAKISDARRLRDADLCILADEYGATEAARRAGVSLSTVKNAVRYRPQPAVQF